eukprot:g165.t1
MNPAKGVGRCRFSLELIYLFRIASRPVHTIRKEKQIFDRRAMSLEIPGDPEKFQFFPLGAGAEVGRSCHIIRFKKKTIMLDCGVHPAKSNKDSLPFLDAIDVSEVDLCLVTHFHLDHAAAVPYLLTKTTFKGRTFMTHATKSIYKLLLQDSVKVSTADESESLYTEKDIVASMSKIEAINYHQVVHHKGIKFWAYAAVRQITADFL